MEKYRPRTLEDMVGFIPSFSIDEDMPHLLLHGGAGTGKTTLAKIIIKMLNANSITLNASSERGIEIVRQKISEFASTQSTNDNIKIVFLDEADSLTADAQTALRNTMETYSRNTRFILTANYVNKIIDPLRSRCISIKFDNIPKNLIVERLEFICKEEKIPYEVEALGKIVDQTGPDMRSAINKIEEMKSGVLVSKLVNETKLAETIFTLIQAKNFMDARQLYLDSHVNPEQFIHDLYITIFNSSKSNEYKQNATLIIVDEYKWLSSVAWPQILIESMIAKLIKL